MKKLLCITLCSLIVIALSAQNPHWGFKAGLNAANLKIDGPGDSKTNTSFHVGALAHVHMGEHLAIQPEVVFSRQGGKYEMGGSDYKTNLSYINVPVLAQYMFGTGFRVQTGPQLGFLVSANSKVDDGEGTDIKDNYKSTDFSWVLGASYVSNSGLGFDARYNLGLSNINDGTGGDVKNRVLQVGIFYQFRVSNYNPKRN